MMDSLSIKNKVILLASVISISALLLLSVILVSYHFYTSTQTQQKKLVSLNKMLAGQIAVALLFEDKRSIQQSLQVLSIDKNITLACVYNKNKHIFIYAIFKETSFFCPDAPLVEGIYFNKDIFELVDKVGISNKSENIGYIYLQANTEQLYNNLFNELGLLVLVFIILMGIIYLLSIRFQRYISRPITHLLDTIRMVSKFHNYKVRVQKSSHDEIGLLVDEFNYMLQQIEIRDEELEFEIIERKLAEKEVRKFNQKLEQRVNERTNELAHLHERLLENAHQAGMAEVATGVLHNIGNVLNSVNTSLVIMKRTIMQNKLELFPKLLDLITEQEESALQHYFKNDEKGKYIPLMLHSMYRYQKQRAQDLLQEISDLGKNIQHIHEIVQAQQNYTKVEHRDWGNMVNQMEDALTLNIAGLNRCQIILHRNYQTIPRQLYDKHKLLQVLINLISNAQYALCNKEGERHLYLSVEEKDAQILLKVVDNGVGIKEDIQTRIFEFGFTTRKDGHGYGLHNAANMVKDMQGELTVSSMGENKGTTFSLWFPKQK